ncbi:hypothetical protein HAX54_018593, partial [Datura stramonium]|nr:hypothetical protein [Datura stramonium]
LPPIPLSSQPSLPIAGHLQPNNTTKTHHFQPPRKLQTGAKPGLKTKPTPTGHRRTPLSLFPFTRTTSTPAFVLRLLRESKSHPQKRSRPPLRPQHPLPKAVAPTAGGTASQNHFLSRRLPSPSTSTSQNSHPLLSQKNPITLDNLSPPRFLFSRADVHRRRKAI